MSSTSTLNLVADPSSALKSLNVKDMHLLPRIAANHFGDAFSSQELFKNIPVLDVLSPPIAHKDRTLVSFRAMVQDTSLSPEIYVAKLPNGECGGWGLSDYYQDGDANGNPVIDNTNLKECTVLWAVSIPGESDWCAEAPPESRKNSSTPQSPTQPQKYPIPGEYHIGAKIKIYDRILGESLRPTDLVNFVGILSQNEISDSTHETGAHALSIPVLHVLFTLPIPTTIISRNFPEPAILPRVKEVRADIISWIATEGLAGDVVAAEWVLLCILSRVQSRSPKILPISLTISGFPAPPDFPQSTTPSLIHVLSSIFPMVSMLPLSLDVFNTTHFSPESKGEGLTSGWLQIPKGSVCVITDGGIVEGNINEKGIANLHVLQNLVRSQILEYVFPFSLFSFDTEINPLMLSRGRGRPFLETDFIIPLQLNSDELDAKQHLYKSKDEIKLPQNEVLLSFRQYVGGARVGQATIGEETATYIQEEYVRERKETSVGSAKITSQELINRMKLTRSMSMTFHASQVTIDSWNATKSLICGLKTRIIE